MYKLCGHLVHCFPCDDGDNRSRATFVLTQPQFLDFKAVTDYLRNDAGTKAGTQRAWKSIGDFVRGRQNQDNQMLSTLEIAALERKLGKNAGDMARAEHGQQQRALNQQPVPDPNRGPYRNR